MQYSSRNCSRKKSLESEMNLLLGFFLIFFLKIGLTSNFAPSSSHMAMRILYQTLWIDRLVLSGRWGKFEYKYCHKYKNLLATCQSHRRAGTPWSNPSGIQVSHCMGQSQTCKYILLNLSLIYYVFKNI